jgi:HdeA/HdeB family protein
MRGLRSSIFAAVLATLCLATQAWSEDIDCDSFIKNPDGSWTVIKKVFIPVQNVRVVEGTIFRPGGTFLGDDMTVRLAKACPNKQVTMPEEPGQPEQSSAQPQAPPVHYVPLSNYADANGNIDIQRLTCAHLAAASPIDVEMLVTWYSGWYAGAAKRRGINLARVQYATRNVADYCKANQNRRLADALKILLKSE